MGIVIFWIDFVEFGGSVFWEGDEVTVVEGVVAVGV